MTKNLTLSVAMAVFCASVAIPVPSVAQHDTDHRQPCYKLIDLGTFGGVTSYINPVGNGGPYMNGKGVVVGSSMTSIPIPPNQNGYPCPSPPDEVFHAMQWGLSGVTELRSLGLSSDCGNALAINDRGETVGTSENGKLDPATGVLRRHHEIQYIDIDHRDSLVCRPGKPKSTRRAGAYSLQAYRPGDARRSQ